MEEAWRHYAETIIAGISQASGGHTTAKLGGENEWRVPVQRAHGRTSSHHAATSKVVSAVHK